jgi:hypothetical protein
MQTSSTVSQVYEWHCPRCDCRGQVSLSVPHVLMVTCQSCVRQYSAGEIIWDQVYQAWITCNSPHCRNVMCQRHV